MNTKLAWQFGYTGLLVGPTDADESPLEEGVFHLPAYCTFTPPPEDVPVGAWPRWNAKRAEWEFATKPQQAATDDPLAKLQAFLAANPDVAGLLTADGALTQPPAANEPT